MSELRPCIVRTGEETITSRNCLGKCETKVVREAAEHKGYFHKWADRFWTIGESPMIGGYSSGQMSQTMGIIEYEDGTVHEHYPTEIKFTDRE